MEFEVYLKSKNIDPSKFKSAEESRFIEFKTLYDQVHPDSFTQQKLFLINKIRRAYLLEEEEVSLPAPSQIKQKPKIKPKLS